MSATLVTGLPAPPADALTVYCFGPGPGEAIVAAVPEDRWIVVDSCLQDGANVSLLLLQRFGVKRLALAALTHPDADHYRGFTEILDHHDVEKTWAYPYALTRRELLAGLARKNPKDSRWAGLSATVVNLERAMSTNRGAQVFALQSRKVGDAVVHCVAPSPADMANESKRLGELHRKVLAEEPLTDEDGYLLRGKKLDGSGNGLSLALVLEWRGQRICLGGDVEAPADPHRGWNGALDYVAAEGRGDLFDDHALVKTAHHASEHAFSEPLYARLARKTRPAALVTPFKGGSRPPPHASTLQALAHRCSTLGITSEPTMGWPAVEHAGWKEHPRKDDGGACCVVAICRADGSVSVEAHGRGRTFDTAGTA